MKKWFSIFFLALMLGQFSLFAANEDQNVSQRIMKLITQVDQLEKTQQELLTSETAILDDIKDLKIFAHR